MPPSNPGEFDYAAWQASRGVVGRLTVPTRGNVDVLAEPGVAGRVSGWLAAVVEGRGWIAERARWSLGLGLTPGSEVTGLLETLLLGETAADIDPLRERFREVGLAHILSISGAHLGILMGLVWMAARAVTGHPPRAAVVVLAVLVMYLLAIPIRVPVARAAVMAGLYFAGVAAGRRPGPTRLLSAAAVIVLLWRPLDLFEPGFQLSFVVVWALLMFVRPVSHWLYPEPLIAPVVPGVGAVVARRAADLAAVSVVAFVTALPLVAYHFQMVAPLALVLSTLGLPVLTGLLGLGYLKVLAGFALPSVSLALAGPLRWLGGALAGLVDEAHTWPGAGITLTQPVSAAWAAGCLAVAVAWFGGAFRGRGARRWRGVAAGVLVSGWLAAEQGAWRWGGEGPAATLTMLAVGDGSCYLLESGGHTLMFDCGSQALPLVGRRSVVPTLKRLGVDRLRRAHPLPRRPRPLQRHARPARRRPRRTGVGLARPPRRRRGPPRLDHRPPHAGAHAPRPRPAGHRGGLHRHARAGRVDGAVAAPGRGVRERQGQRAVGRDAGRRRGSAALAQRRHPAGRDQLHCSRDPGALDADVTDLPHHGSVVDASPDWLAAVSPRIVLQSTGPVRLHRDRWADLLAPFPEIDRYLTARHGMVQVILGRDGMISVTPFREPRGEDAAATK